MKNPPLKSWRLHDILIAYVVLFFLFLYTYGLLFKTPYPGFYFNPSNGELLEIYQPANPPLKIGDFIQRVGSISIETYRQNKWISFFDGMQAGQQIEIEVLRDQKSVTILWEYPGYNTSEFQARFFNIWWLAYVFWFIGMSTQLFMRPKDTQWRLFVAANYLTGAFIMLGSVSSLRVFGSAILLRAVTWLILPTYLHFHWIFPKSFRRIPQWLKNVFYVICGGITIWQLFSQSFSGLYFFAIALAFGGSILLLAAHYLLQPNHRREVMTLAIAAFSSTFFTFLISLIGIRGDVSKIGPLALLPLPILPATYFYILYRRNLGGLEIRTNRVISIYLFLITLGFVLLLIIGYSKIALINRDVIAITTVIIALFTALASILAFPKFQSFVEKRILGIKLPNESLAESYSARIITSDSLPILLKLLRDEVFPSLLIRQYAFVRNLKTSAEVILSENVTQDLVTEDALMELFASSSKGNLSPFSKHNPPFDWVRLTLPLQFGSELIGIWLLGRRDPDDHYSPVEFPSLQSLANQTAVALSNIIQTEHLKAVYGANIHRYEQERVNLAHDLHDSVLNEMAAMKMKLDPASLPPEFQLSYDELINRVREIVGDLRPPMLLYGLKFALNGLADNLSERHRDKVNIIADIEADGEPRYPEIVEQNIYRIVQEACENASKYARAKSIVIEGKLFEKRIEVKVIDDGIGFRDEISLKLDDMLANKHFGLAGMHERADLIGAAIRIDSKPKHGTRIQVSWEAKDTI
ncbi:MAG: hypothetical protein IPP66_09315 [Anaerolineales bacterium]|nr:hypothetical protein [Anaerolineales bacterium]